MMTNNNKFLINSNNDSNNLNIKRNLLLTNQINESHLRSQLDNEDIDHEEVMDSDKADDTNDDSETDSGSGSDGDESPGLYFNTFF